MNLHLPQVTYKLGSRPRRPGQTRPRARPPHRAAGTASPPPDRDGIDASAGRPTCRTHSLAETAQQAPSSTSGLGRRRACLQLPKRLEPTPLLVLDELEPLPSVAPSVLFLLCEVIDFSVRDELDMQRAGIHVALGPLLPVHGGLDRGRGADGPGTVVRVVLDPAQPEVGAGGRDEGRRTLYGGRVVVVVRASRARLRGEVGRQSCCL